ncbi:MAG: hypothetical protein J0I99_05240 [Devosia sp.]|uniref:hypothetical protein n=1 Tax=Devosia sp. TaxID=1871048 RepID=UPI001AC07F1E|nr:hypothetical protein [Devosia sp.]MBN9315121.1 hypothetical protein [Devosia sp.]
MKYNLVALTLAGVLAASHAHAQDGFFRETDRLTSKQATYLSHHAQDGAACVNTKLEVLPLLQLVELEALAYDCSSGQPLAFRVPNFGTEFIARALFNDVEFYVGFSLAGYKNLARGTVSSLQSVPRLHTIKVLYQLASGIDALVEYNIDEPAFQDYVRPLLRAMPRPDYFSADGQAIVAERAIQQQLAEAREREAAAREREAEARKKEAAAREREAEAKKNPNPLRDSLVSQLRGCVALPAGAAEADARATFRFSVDASGYLVGRPEMIGSPRNSSEYDFATAVSRALQRCGPFLLDPLPVDFGQDLEITFAAIGF